MHTVTDRACCRLLPLRQSFCQLTIILLIVRLEEEILTKQSNCMNKLQELILMFDFIGDRI